MSLAQKQQLFARLIGEFLVWIYDADGPLAVTFGEAYRTAEQAALNAQHGTGIANSLHRIRLAIDLNLFVNGVYQTSSEAYRELGEKWESMHSLARWGGRFTRPDGNHFSLEHDGVR